MRDRDWRYIRYADGSEELYHDAEDPGEYRNLAGLPEHTALKTRLAAVLPASEVPATAKPVKPAKAGKKKKKPASN